jgi:hypothetical protein
MAGIKVPAVSTVTVCYHSMMRWLQWTPDRNGIVAVALATVIIVCVFAFLMIYFPDLQQRGAASGFGPDWDCTAQPKGDPVCIKKPGR